MLFDTQILSQSIMMAIASTAAECAQLFDNYARRMSEDGLFIQEMESHIFRFNLWIANEFILAPSRASMDWRLRAAPWLQATIMELLDDLKVDLTSMSLPLFLSPQVGAL